MRQRGMSPRIRVSALIVLLLGCLINVVAYDSVQPLLACALVFLAVTTLLSAANRPDGYEQRMFHTVFAVGWLMAGVAAVYANFLHDYSQTASDPAWFFDLASGRAGVQTLHSLESISEGAGAIILWRWVYNAFAAIGFARAPYIGILVNVVDVALSGVLAVKITRLVYGDELVRLNRLVRLFAWCGLLWLFAAIHLRDSAILLAVTWLVYVWVRYLAHPGLENLVVLAVGTVADTALITLLRTDFLFVPLAMLFAGLVVSLVYDKSRGTRKLVAYGAGFAGVIIAAVLYATYYQQISNSLVGGYKLYVVMARQGAATGSLGMAVIVNQPLPVRLLFGSGFLYVYPIPFWAGLREHSAYGLFKSLNALFFYAFIPALVLSPVTLVRDSSLRTPPLMFLFLLVIGFTLAVAGTSGETRHLGAFLVPIFVLALVADLKTQENWRAYQKLRLVFLGLMAAVHLAWFALKL